MPAIRTEVTEITTGLAMLGFSDLDRALAARPDWLRHVGEAEFDRLDRARAEAKLDPLFEAAWENGRRFLHSTDGLRGRVPDRVEWKGHHKPPGYDRLPADLRVDHVYLISCKYGSNLLHNVSPANLFDRCLRDRRGDRTDWYWEVAPDAYQELFVACSEHVDTPLPDDVRNLTADQRSLLKRSFKRTWPDGLGDVAAAFAQKVAWETADRWRSRLTTRKAKEEMLWRLLRLETAPYFVLGQAQTGRSLHYRTATPWDFRDRYRATSFDVFPEAAQQPVVRWRAEVVGSEGPHVIEGHVEVRWSHGRFHGVPEAKAYLDTPHHDVAGYDVLR